MVNWVYKSRQRNYMQVNKLEKNDGIRIATELQLVTKEGRQTVHSTFLRLQIVKFNQHPDDSVFTVRTLEKGL